MIHNIDISKWGYIFWDINIMIPILYRCIFGGDKGNRKRLFLFVSFLHMFIILAIRSSLTGVDSVVQYPSVFRAATKLSFIELIKRWSFLQQMRLWPWTGSKAESGYVLLNWIFGHLLGLSYRTYLVWFSFFDAYCVYKYLEKNSDAPLLGVMTVYKMLLYFYCHHYRRMMGMNMSLLALLALEDKHYKRAYLFMFLAFNMHRSSLILWVFLILARITVTKKVLKNVGVFAALSSLVPPSLIYGFLRSAFAIFGKSGHLMQGTAVLGVVLTSYSYRLLGPMYVAFLVFMYFFIDEEILQRPHNNLLCWIFLFYVAISPMDSAFPIISQEIGYYFRPSIFIFLTNMLVDRKGNKFVKATLWTIVLLAFVWSQRAMTLRQPYDKNGLRYEYRTMFQTKDGF